MLNKQKGNMIKCQCGCGKEILSFDSRGRPRKRLNGHGRKNVYNQLENRFWEKVIINKDKCWKWTGSKDINGYGRIKGHGSLLFAHRVSFQIAYGNIPLKMEVCHKCDNPECVNPKHLFLGAHKDNMLDSIKKDRWSGAKIKLIEVKEIKEKSKKNILQKDIAEEYNISQGQVSRIVNGASWS